MEDTFSGSLLSFRVLLKDPAPSLLLEDWLLLAEESSSLLTVDWSLLLFWRDALASTCNKGTTFYELRYWRLNMGK